MTKLNNLDPHDANEIREAQEFLRDLKVFQEWMASLAKPDQDNFKLLINLPTAREILARSPDETYREMGYFALHILKIQKGSLESGEKARETSLKEKVRYVKMDQGESRC